MIGILFAIFSAMSFAMNNVLSKKSIMKIGIWNSLFYIYLTLSIFSAILVLFLGDFNHELNLEIIVSIIFGGLIGMIGIWALLKSFEKINVTETLVVANSYPFISLILFVLFLNQQVSIPNMIIMAILFVGIIITLFKPGKFKLNKNIIYPIITSVSWGFYYFLLNYLSSWNINAFNVLFYVETALFLSILGYIVIRKSEKISIMKIKVPFESYLAGIFATGGVLFFILSAKIINPSISASIVSSQIVFASVLSIFMFKEKLSIYNIIGMIIVFICLVLFNLV